MSKFTDDLRKFAAKQGERLETVDRAFKFGMFGDVVRNTRVADPMSWKQPDPDYRGGTLRGNWQVSTGTPATGYTPGKLNTGEALPAGEAANIKPFSLTYLANNVPYALVYEEKDGMVRGAIARANRRLREAVADA